VNERPLPPEPPADARDLGDARTYSRVLAIEALVLVLLWLFSRTFR
jgi:hypothetical protein